MPDLAAASHSPAVRQHLTKWKRLAPLGLASVGFGLSLVGQATIRKSEGRPFVAYGTVALCVVNAGLCLFGESVKHRALADWRQASGQ